MPRVAPSSLRGRERAQSRRGRDSLGNHRRPVPRSMGATYLPATREQQSVSVRAFYLRCISGCSAALTRIFLTHILHMDAHRRSDFRLSRSTRRSCATLILRRNPVISSRRRGLARRSAWCLYRHPHDSLAEHCGSGRLGAWADKKRVLPSARADAQLVGFPAIDTACQRSTLGERSS